MSKYTYKPSEKAKKYKEPDPLLYAREFPDVHTEWADHLNEHGWAVVKGVVPKERCEYYYNGMWDFMERFGTGIDRNKPSTWKNSNWPSVLHGGLMQHYGVGHEQFVWDARSEEGVINAFATLWGTDELLVSFDGINLTRPRKYLADINLSPWPHTDQSGITKGFSCIQGVINLLPNGPEDGGLIVLDKSHKKHAEYFETFPHRLNASDWVRIEKAEMGFYSDCKQTRVCGDPGDLLLFDSRTIHWAEEPKGDIFRAAIYVCMQPASFATPGQIAAKKDAFFNKRMTSHWPHKVKLFNLNARPAADGRIDGKILSHDLPVLSERAQKLAGLIPY